MKSFLLIGKMFVDTQGMFGWKIKRFKEKGIPQLTVHSFNVSK